MREVHLGDAGRYRDDTAQHGQKPADKDSEGPPALEEPVDAHETIVREVHVLSITLDDRHAAEAADRVAHRVAGPLPGPRDADRQPEVAQVAGGREPAGDWKNDLGADRDGHVPQCQADEQAEIAVRVDERHDRLLEVFHRLLYSRAEAVFRVAARRRISAAELPPSMRKASKRSLGPIS